MSEDPTREGTRRPTPEAVARVSLVVVRGPDAGRAVTLDTGEGASVGSADGNDLMLTDRTVSRYHLEIEPGPDGFVVKDLGSRNGTFAGGVRIREGIVGRGAQLRVGDSLLVVDAAESGGSASPPAGSPELLPGMVYASAAMHGVAERVTKIADRAAAVLVQGETGTGKELVAAAVHALSSRRSGPFVTVDCAALPATLLEAELFGHERGAFTGADRARAGAFERAHGGTVFLDEVGELSLAAQGALLGVLERRRFRRVGGDREIQVDVRVVSATNRDLREEVNRGTFREDLWFRLAGARIVVPPLRDRPEDIPVLVRRFAAEQTGTEDALPVEAFTAQRWRGNVRELKSAVERAIAFGMEDLELPETGAPIEGGPVVRYRDAKATAIADFERAYVGRLIDAAEGNASEAARRAQMDRPFLLGLLRKYGLR